MNQYVVYKIFTRPFNPELLSGLFWNFKLSGLVEEDDYIEIYLADESYLSEIQLRTELEKLKKEQLIKSFTIRTEVLLQKNWNELWEKSREVIHISDKIKIKPSFKKYSAKEGELVLTIDPKMSFGTGEHQSTKLVLQLIEKYTLPGMRILDVGSGTGILSIAAVKLGAESALAVDFDEICFENCKENCRINGVENQIKILTGTVADIKEKNFDLIFANIHKNVLTEIARDLKAKLKRNGKLLLAGLLAQDKKEIELRYHSLGFNTKKIVQMDEWIAVVMQK